MCAAPMLPEGKDVWVLLKYVAGAALVAHDAASSAKGTMQDSW